MGDNLGVGISYMNAIGEQIEQHLAIFDFIEAYSERFFIKDDNSRLRRITKEKPLVLHGLDLSIGSPEPIDGIYCEKFKSMTLSLIERLKKTNK